MAHQPALKALAAKSEQWLTGLRPGNMAAPCFQPSLPETGLPQRVLRGFLELCRRPFARQRERLFLPQTCLLCAFGVLKDVHAAVLAQVWRADESHLWLLLAQRSRGSGRASVHSRLLVAFPNGAEEGAAEQLGWHVEAQECMRTRARGRPKQGLRPSSTRCPCGRMF